MAATALVPPAPFPFQSMTDSPLETTLDTPRDASEMLRRVTGQLAVWQRPLDALNDISRGLVQHADMASCVVTLRLCDSECDVCRETPPAVPSNAPRLHRITQASSGGFRFDPALHIVASGSLLTAEAAEERRLLRVENLIERYGEMLRRRGTSVEDHPHIDELKRQGIKAGLFIPMVLQDELIGVLSLLFRRAPSDDEVRHLEIFALQAGASIRAAQLLREVAELRGRLEEENAYLQGAIEQEGGFAGIIGRSAALRVVLQLVQRVADSDATVLITGETGTGKELIARAIHAGGPRASHPLIKVNCGAISPSLVESELFGHEKGAFTGAVRRRLGRFELADRGSLFLDEVGELPPETQVKLLRVLQEREFERVGGERPVPVDVRVIAATHRNLPAEVAAGRFRPDLYYRLNVFPIAVPPLRERRGDIPELTSHFVAQFARALNKPITAVTREGLARLVDYDWPGNIRELQNVIERACVLARGPRIDIPQLARTGEGAAAPTGEPAHLTLEAVERAHIVRVLEAVHWRVEGVGGAASILGLNPSTLRSRMRRLGVRRSRATRP